MLNKLSIVLGIVGILFVGVLFSQYAHPFKGEAAVIFGTACQTNTSTTSLTYFPGKNLGTTTLSCTLVLGDAPARAVEGATMNIWYAATSTPEAALAVQLWWSQDNISYYPGTYLGSQLATTSEIVTNAPLTITYDPTATSSPTMQPWLSGLELATTSTSFEIPIPQKAKYLKAYFYETGNTTSSAFWAEIVPRYSTI